MMRGLPPSPRRAATRSPSAVEAKLVREESRPYAGRASAKRAGAGASEKLKGNAEHLQFADQRMLHRRDHATRGGAGVCEPARPS